MARICLVVLLFGLCDPSSVAQVEVAHVAGQVVLYNGVPVEGADVRFFLLDGVRGLPTKETLVREVKTDHQGKYEVRELPAGSYRVVVELLGYGNNEVWRFYVWRGAERWLEVALARGTTHGLETASVSGKVTAQSGRPIVDATVTLVSAHDVGDYSQTRTDGEGRYTLSTLEPGDYVAWATKEGFAATARALEVRNGGKQTAAFQLVNRGR